MTALPDRGPRWTLAGLSVLHAAVFAPAAMILPWRTVTTFALLAGALAILHLAVAVLAASASQRLLRVAWRATAFASLAFLLWSAWTVGSSALYLAEVYGAIGTGVGAALLALLAPVALLTLPFALWGLTATGGIRPRGARLVATSALLAVGLAAAGWVSAPRASATALVHPAAPPATHQGWAELPDSSGAPQLGEAGPATCAGKLPLDSGDATALVAFTTHDGTPAMRCVQSSTDELWAAVALLLEAEATRNPVAVDLVIESRPLDVAPPGLGGLALRPGYDGVCTAASCLAPWQLLGRDAFISETPLAFIPDMRIGTSEAMLRGALGVRDEPLLAIRTEQYVLDETGHWQRLVRLRHEARPLTAEALDQAAVLAEEHVIAAQTSTGVFRYKLAPTTGRGTSAGWALPRQAGTTLTLCEQGSDDQRVSDTIARSLATMAQREHSFGGHAVLTESNTADRASLGGSALPLIALLRCRARAGDRHDELIGRLVRTVMALQRPTGGFRQGFMREDGAFWPGGEPLYAGGQAVMALLLAESVAATSPAAAAHLPPQADLAAAADRAMDYYGGEYWDFPMRDFFYIEENWHCLAAVVGLERHRHEAYEQFCLDYVGFKLRTALDADSGVDETFIGAHGFGNIIPPHNTPTGGLGEILSAAVALQQARGEDAEPLLEQLRATAAFLVRQQWTPGTCFACAQGKAIGAWSESISSGMVRIDFVQHSWSALGHARGLLFADGEPGAGPTVESGG